MNWEDTVMECPIEMCMGNAKRIPSGDSKLCEGCGYKDGVKAQAEITWDLAIKEVVEWLERHKVNEVLTPDSARIWKVVMTGWKAQLKEWGIC